MRFFSLGDTFDRKLEGGLGGRSPFVHKRVGGAWSASEGEHWGRVDQNEVGRKVAVERKKNQEPAVTPPRYARNQWGQRMSSKPSIESCSPKDSKGFGVQHRQRVLGNVEVGRSA